VYVAVYTHGIAARANTVTRTFDSRNTSHDFRSNFAHPSTKPFRTSDQSQHPKDHPGDDHGYPRDEMKFAPRPARARLEDVGFCGVNTTRSPILVTENSLFHASNASTLSPLAVDFVKVWLRKIASHWLQLAQVRIAGSRWGSIPSWNPRNGHSE
jgi:hypothetical protein